MNQLENNIAFAKDLIENLTEVNFNNLIKTGNFSKTTSAVAIAYPKDNQDKLRVLNFLDKNDCITDYVLAMSISVFREENKMLEVLDFLQENNKLTTDVLAYAIGVWEQEMDKESVLLFLKKCGKLNEEIISKAICIWHDEKHNLATKQVIEKLNLKQK